MFKVRFEGERLYFTHENIEGRFSVPMGNSKVRMPIINGGSGLECPNSHKCPFSIDNYKKTDYPLCYAQKGERRLPSVKKSKDMNEYFIHALTYYELTDEFTKLLAEQVATYAPFTPYVRINEAHDLSPENIDFFQSLQVAFCDYDIMMYGYSKSHKDIVKQLVGAGATIITSEVDFVMVKSEEEAAEKGLEVCPGVCGPCTRCMDGLQTAVVAH